MNSSVAAASSGVAATLGQVVDIAVALHGRSRPRPPPASSTRPYLESCRRWNQQLWALSPRRCPAWVAVSGPSVRSRPISRRRSGCATARSARGSVSSSGRRGAIYQIYPRSFGDSDGDSDGDGVGDLRGIAAHLDHLSDRGVEAVWLSPIYRS